MNNETLARLGARLYQRHWGRMFFFSACIAAGVAFLFTIGNLIAAVNATVASRARELMSADVSVGSNRPFEAKARSAFSRLEEAGARGADAVSFNSMVQPAKPGTAPFLAAVKAVEDSYPFYGQLIAAPAEFRRTLLGAAPACLIDETIALQHGLAVGDELLLGGLKLSVAGVITKEPDRAFSGFTLAPRVLIPLKLAARTKLIRFGSRIRHEHLIALPLSQDPAKAAQDLKTRLEKELDDPYLHIQAYEDAETTTREALQRTTVFFVLISLVALILGAVGMAASVTMFLNGQLETVGMLRCLGLGPRHIARLYHGLCLLVGLQGGFLGVAAGWGLSGVVLKLAAHLVNLKIAVPRMLDFAAVAESLALACLLSVAVNWAKVRALASLSPLDILHERVTRLPASRLGMAASLAGGLLAAFAYTWVKSSSLEVARDFSLSLVGAAAAVMLLIAAAIQGLSKATGIRALPLRHGLLQLTRQRGRTMVFLFTLSIGFSLLGALRLVHRGLAKEILLSTASTVPDLFLVDLQKNQVPQADRLVSRYSADPADFAPLIRARLTHVNGIPIARRDLSGMNLEKRSRHRWMTREYNLTYKDFLNPSEKVVKGEFWERRTAVPQISLEEGFAKRTRISLGDTLRFDIQGRSIEAPVTSLRSVSWTSMKPNFFVVFPGGVLDDAPQAFVGALRIRDPVKSARFQRELVKAFPNVSVIDITKILDNVSAVLGTLLAALQALAWFCVAIGLLVLAGTLSLGQKERRETAALFRALGSRRSDVLLIDAVEFLAIGAITFLIACVVSYGLGYVLAWRMEITFVSEPGAQAPTLAAALLLPLAVGLAVNWRAYGSGVMESLRREA